MNHLLMLAVLVTSGNLGTHGKEENREQMLTDVVKINGSIFKSYGCYCGVDGLGHGDPKDYIDVCCQILNCCYESLKDFQCNAATKSYNYTYDGEDVECSLSSANGNLVQFADMVRKVTGKLPSLFFNGYGCYCGLGGSKQPLDETDWCCHTHDCCYGKMSSLGCDPKMETYSYFFSKGALSCSGKTMCLRMICECDKEAALCFRRAAKTYNIRNVYYPNIFCRGATPPC